MFFTLVVLYLSHVYKTCQKPGALKRLSEFLPSQLLNKLYQSNIQSIIDYCCTVWGHSGSGNLSKLQIYQNRAARIVCKYCDHDIHGIDLVRYLGWHTVEDRIKYFTSVLMFKCLNNIVPEYISDSFTFLSDIHQHFTRNSTNGSLFNP